MNEALLQTREVKKKEFPEKIICNQSMDRIVNDNNNVAEKGTGIVELAHA